MPPATVLDQILAVEPTATRQAALRPFVEQIRAILASAGYAEAVRGPLAPEAPGFLLTPITPFDGDPAFVDVQHYTAKEATTERQVAVRRYQAALEAAGLRCVAASWATTYGEWPVLSVFPPEVP